MRKLGSYKNGNYTVTIYNDGTKVRENDLDFFQSAFPENIDIKISNQCDLGCPMCHENSTPDGDNADLLSLSFVDTLRPYTELAIGGGNVFANPQFIPFLEKLKEKQIIANITVNQAHFEKNFETVLGLIHDKLVYGVGVSLNNPTEKFIGMVKKAGRNVVIHTINGILSPADVRVLSQNGLKILILGYKNFGRGTKYLNDKTKEIEQNQKYLYSVLPYFTKLFSVVSFDNLAIEQLQPQRFLSKEQFNEFYMGDEGQFTMYIDAVKREFGENSIAKVRYPILETIDEMFSKVKEKI